jgi:metallophosphoesterase (TIGR03767 family)
VTEHPLASWTPVKLTRRGLLRSGAVAGGAATAATRPAASAAGALPPLAPRSRRGRASATVRRVLLPGKPGPRGYRTLVVGPGEKHLLRTDLGIEPQRFRIRRRKALIAFAQLTDVHVVDAQSPLRVEYTDRFDDPSSAPATGIFVSAYRPHEMLSGHIADAMVRELNAIGRGPVTGKPLALAIQTGDNSDNSQLNEIRWNIDLLDGRPVAVDSGDLTRYEGVSDDDPTYYDTHYWHPHGTPTGKEDDIPRKQRGFPTVPGLLDAARRPFQAAGLRMPWYSAFGNHDGLAQGNFPATLQLNTIATGPAKLISTPLGYSPADVADALQSGDVTALMSAAAASGAIRTVTADPNRRLLNRKEIVEEHFRAAGAPTGHGFTARNREDGTAYYSFDRGLIRFIVLDTVNPNGYADGSIDATQFDWLYDLLHSSANRVVIVCSHHTSDTMNNPLVGTGGDQEERVTGDKVLELLLANHEVVAWVNGHTHKNQIWAHKRPKGGGLWEINTASHIDWPQQSRIIEIVDNRDKTVSIFTTLVDHAGPRSYGGRTSTSVQLASLGRELAANDWHIDAEKHRGARNARNVELVVKAPLVLRKQR